MAGSVDMMAGAGGNVLDQGIRTGHVDLVDTAYDAGGSVLGGAVSRKVGGDFSPENDVWSPSYVEPTPSSKPGWRNATGIGGDYNASDDRGSAAASLTGAGLDGMSHLWNEREQFGLSLRH